MATETHDAAGHAAEASGGMPQLDFSTFGNQIFWLMVTLVVIYFVLSRIALPRIASVLAERQGTITGDIAAAEALKAKAVEAEEAYNKALADARAEAQNIVAKTKQDMQAELAEAMKQADAQIAEKTAESEKAITEIRANALSSISDVATDTAEALVSALGGKADAKSIKAAIAAQMKG